MRNLEREVNWIVRDKYNGKTLPVLNNDIVRLKAGEPIDYIIGWKEFLGCKIDLSKKPLIPREETEYWVERVIKNLEFKNQNLRVLDIFSGSGCIGLAVLKNLPKVKVVFAEKDKKMCEQIKINCQLNNVDKKRYEIIQSNVFSKITGKFDIVFANPPYIPTGRKLAKSVIKYEPKSALFSGADGLEIIKKFLKQAKNHLRPNGKIFLEFDGATPKRKTIVGAGQKAKIEEILKQEGDREWKFYRDQYSRWRWVEINP